MKKDPGMIVQTDKGEYGIARNSMQTKEMLRSKNYLLAMFYDPECTQPISVVQAGKSVHKQIVKSAEKCKIIGFID